MRSAAYPDIAQGEGAPARRRRRAAPRTCGGAAGRPSRRRGPGGALTPAGRVASAPAQCGRGAAGRAAGEPPFCLGAQRGDGGLVQAGSEGRERLWGEKLPVVEVPWEGSGL